VKIVFITLHKIQIFNATSPSDRLKILPELFSAVSEGEVFTNILEIFDNRLEQLEARLEDTCKQLQVREGDSTALP
jgi:hypothetical protein